MPFVLVVEPMTTLEDVVPRPPRKPHSTTQKQPIKKMKVSVDTRLEVSTSQCCSPLPFTDYCC
jgi:hypothetical protein